MKILLILKVKVIVPVKWSYMSSPNYVDSFEKLTKLKIPKHNIKTLMKKIHENAIKYLTYLVLNKRKLDNKQTPVPPP
jgi:hypothetical protein